MNREIFINTEKESVCIKHSDSVLVHRILSNSGSSKTVIPQSQKRDNLKYLYVLDKSQMNMDESFKYLLSYYYDGKIIQIIDLHIYIDIDPVGIYLLGSYKNVVYIYVVCDKIFSLYKLTINEFDILSEIVLDDFFFLENNPCSDLFWMSCHESIAIINPKMNEIKKYARERLYGNGGRLDHSILFNDIIIYTISGQIYSYNIETDERKIIIDDYKNNNLLMRLNIIKDFKTDHHYLVVNNKMYYDINNEYKLIPENDIDVHGHPHNTKYEYITKCSKNRYRLYKCDEDGEYRLYISYLSKPFVHDYSCINKNNYYSLLLEERKMVTFVFWCLEQISGDHIPDEIKFIIIDHVLSD